ncbi:DUF6378 domain-containing protein [Nocardioides sp. R1-1]|uniref:DUF6378 domain-containing protein n=1 Tax=Nocardioides sp. R1-1 TaxID=3383502 RepID=UPI0038D03D60
MPRQIPTALMLEDEHGDHLRVSRRLKRNTVHLTVGHGGSGCHVDLTMEQARAVAEYLRVLAGEGEVAEVTAAPPTPVEDEAKALVFGDREDDYGHPRQSFTRIAALWSILLGDKLEDGEWIAPEDVARLMVAFKLARDVANPKRDNRVDGIGYLISLDRLETGR